MVQRRHDGYCLTFMRAAGVRHGRRREKPKRGWGQSPRRAEMQGMGRTHPPAKRSGQSKMKRKSGSGRKTEKMRRVLQKVP